MRHHYTIQRGAYGLRPVRMDDAGFIVELRTDPERGRFINATPREVARQEAWLREYFERDADYYFVIEDVKTGEREGTLGIYNVDERERAAEWGRWIVRRGSKAAVRGGCLALDLAFGELGLESVYSYVAAGHGEAITLLRAIGMRNEASLPGYLSLGGLAHDAVRMRISRLDWEDLK